MLFSRLTLRVRFFLLIAFVTLLSLLGVWLGVKPYYDSAISLERLTIISETQRDVMHDADKLFSDWIADARYLRTVLQTRPADFEGALRELLATQKEVALVKAYSLSTRDSLFAESQNFPTVSVQPRVFVPTSRDTSIRVGWVWQDSSLVYLVLQIDAAVNAATYRLYFYFDAQNIRRPLLEIPLSERTYSRVTFLDSSLFETAFSESNSDLFPPVALAQGLSKTELALFRGEPWLSSSAQFQALPMSYTVAVPQADVLRPIREIVKKSLYFILAFAAAMLVGAWFITQRLANPIAELVKSVAPIRQLDFSTPIAASTLPDLKTLSESTEQMRRALERYQKINVEKLIVEESKNRFLMERSDDLIAIINEKEEFVFLNGRMKDLFEKLALPLESRRSAFLEHPLVKLNVQAERGEPLASFQVSFRQSELSMMPEQEVLVFKAQEITIVNPDKGTWGGLLILHDLSAERELEKIKTHTLGIVVHELRSPTAGVIGLSEFLLDDQYTFTDEERVDFITSIHKNGVKLNNLVNRFLNVMRMESGQIAIEKKPHALVSIIRELIESLEPQSQKKEVAFSFAPPTSFADVPLSREFISEAIQNLMSNAIKYGPKNRTILLTLDSTYEHAIFTITDYGYGIPPEAQKKLFTKFYRVSDERTRAEIGTGLGLVYVKDIITRHGGDILLESSPEIGCRFIVKLPLA
jgi:signal transduction histidine kinase/HAMP domain-containing protein